MKIKQLAILLLFLVIGQFVNAQSGLKIGHVNIQELVQKHPASDSIKIILENETKEMEKLYSEMIEEHDVKLGLFEKEKSGYSDFVRSSKEKELIDLAQKIQEYNQDAQQQLQRRNMELLQPLYVQINSTKKEMSDREEFTYVLDISNGSVAYVSPNSHDLNPAIIKKLKNKGHQNN